ncbi:MAG: long-chain-fatty-acid--CoA ligase [Candidatus Tectimicrobiota bacterium]|nr:MAG: long-chain-fatty-acid--CoA ligase [Candidatus Tectomicrobia bacterium]
MRDEREVYATLRRKTAPLVLLERAAATPTAVAYRAKKRGIYHERTWAQLRDLVAACALGLQHLGLRRGERLAIMGEACEEWMLTDLAAQALGAITYGIYPTASPAELAYQLRDGGAAIFVAEDQEYVDKVWPLLGQLPALRWVVVIDATALFLYAHPRLITFAELLRRGKEALAQQPEAFEAHVRALDPRDPAFIVYTSGTTGDPKGALVRHGAHLAAAYTLLDHYPQLRQRPHRTVVFLPLCHVLGRDVAITLPLLSRLVPHYGERRAELVQTLFEVAPTVLFLVPRYLQKFAAQVLVGIENSTPLKRRLYRLALQAGRRYVRRRWQGQAGGAAALWYAFWRWLVFRPMLAKLGLDKLALALSGGAALPPEVMALWQIYGVDLVEIYGQTETGGAIISGQPAGFPRPGNVGVPPRGWQVRLDFQGEILVRGEDLFAGYWGKPQATREVLDAEGWLHTGDVGAWDERGQLRIIDRARDFLVTAGGKTLSPTAIENLLRASPYISEAVVFGHQRKYLTALIEIDYDTVSDWARLHNVPYTGFTSLATRPEVQALIQAEVDKANAQLARVEQIKAFRILPQELDPEAEGEPVTPTRKVKRQQMYDKFKALVESMYSREEEALLAAHLGEVLEAAAGQRRSAQPPSSARGEV